MKWDPWDVPTLMSPYWIWKVRVRVGVKEGVKVWTSQGSRIALTIVRTAASAPTNYPADISAAPLPVWSCPLACAARWWGLTSSWQSAGSLPGSRGWGEQPWCCKPGAPAGQGSPWALWRLHAVWSTTSSSPTGCAERGRANRGCRSVRGILTNAGKQLWWNQSNNFLINAQYTHQLMLNMNIVSW